MRSYSKTEAGCRILINMMLLRLASAMQNEKIQLNIIPEFPIPKTTFETDSGEQTFSGVVDFLLARIPPKYSRKQTTCVLPSMSLQFFRLFA